MSGTNSTPNWYHEEWKPAYMIIKALGIKKVNVKAVHLAFGLLRYIWTNKLPSTFINAQSPIQESRHNRIIQTIFAGFFILGLSHILMALRPRKSVKITLCKGFNKISPSSKLRSREPNSKYTNAGQEINAKRASLYLSLFVPHIIFQNRVFLPLKSNLMFALICLEW